MTHQYSIKPATNEEHSHLLKCGMICHYTKLGRRLLPFCPQSMRSLAAAKRGANGNGLCTSCSRFLFEVFAEVQLGGAAELGGQRSTPEIPGLLMVFCIPFKLGVYWVDCESWCTVNLRMTWKLWCNGSSQVVSFNAAISACEKGGGTGDGKTCDTASWVDYGWHEQNHP